MALGDKLRDYTIGLKVKDTGFKPALDKMGGQLKTFVTSAIGILGATSLGSAFSKFLNTGKELSNFSELTGIRVEDITALGGALEKFGGNVNNAKSSLQALQQGLSQAEWGEGKLFETSAKYGIKLFNDDGSLKNAQQLMWQLSVDFQKLSKPQQMRLGQELGLDESTILLLQQGRAGMKALLDEQSRLSAISARDAQKTKLLANEFNKLKQSAGRLGRDFAISLLPSLKKIADWLQKAMKFVKDLDGSMVLLAVSFGGLIYAIKNFEKFMKVFSMSFLKANWPIILLVTGLTTLFLIIEDIYSYTKGKKSVFGEMMKNENFAKVIKTLTSAFGKIKDVFEKSFGWVKNLINGFSLEKIIDKVKMISENIKNVFVDTFDYLKAVISTLGNNLGAYILKPILSVLKNVPVISGYLDNISLPEIKQMPSYSQFTKEREQARAIYNTTDKSGDNIFNINTTITSKEGASYSEMFKEADNSIKNKMNMFNALLTGAR